MEGSMLGRNYAARGVKPTMSAGVLALAVFALMVLAGCAQGQPIARPPDIHYGEDLCVSCGMVISDVRFAAAAAHEVEPGRYESSAFDDIGDMVHYIKQNPDLKFTNFWAHDYGDESWVDASSAWFVVSPQIKSPMMHGVAAFASQEAASSLAADVAGEVLDWNHMRATVLMHNH
jgi:copper chaperone NosL